MEEHPMLQQLPDRKGVYDLKHVKHIAASGGMDKICSLWNHHKILFLVYSPKNMKWNNCVDMNKLEIASSTICGYYIFYKRAKCAKYMSLFWHYRNMYSYAIRIYAMIVWHLVANDIDYHNSRVYWNGDHMTTYPPRQSPS